MAVRLLRWVMIGSTKAPASSMLSREVPAQLARAVSDVMTRCEQAAHSAQPTMEVERLPQFWVAVGHNFAVDPAARSRRSQVLRLLGCRRILSSWRVGW